MNTPAVLKPVDGRRGSMDTFYLEGPDLPEAAQRLSLALLQPFVPGEPMSASFLVSPEGRAWLLGLGRQRIEIQSGRFEYRGGELPADCPEAAHQVRSALGTMEGLRGFVGIDFIWDRQRRKATIIEINPRPTTSLVGLCRLLPAGRLARAWLEVFRSTGRDDELLESLFGLVHSHEPVVFDADGEFAGLLRGQSNHDQRIRSRSRSLRRPRHRRGQYQGRPQLRSGAHDPVRGLEAARRPGAGDRDCRWRHCPSASNRAVLTMTAELCDCYPTKAIGVGAVLDAAVEGLQGRPIVVWGTDGQFHLVPEIRQDPGLAAAANWLALATVAARLVPSSRGVLIDIGTTTADLIPLDSGQVRARGRTDTERFQTGELVYAGVRRTPICALATELPLRGIPTGLAAEIFASTLDVYLILGDIEQEPDNLSTADGRRATATAARDRLARMVGADRDGFSAQDAVEFAQAADECLTERLCQAALRACTATIGAPEVAVVSGSGSFLARRLANRLVGPGRPVISLEEAWGVVASSAGCAFALVTLAAERLGDDAAKYQDPEPGALEGGRSP